jgi:oligopeptide/dipeptide ABC transporter ATP-binding protein
LNRAGKSLLEIKNLSLIYSQAGGEPVRALQGVNLQVRPGEILGVLGESGCGKSTLAHAIAGIVQRSAKVVAGEIFFDGADVLRLPEEKLRSIRGRQLSLVPQEPALSLNPVLTVGTQIGEVLRAHIPMNGKDRRARIDELLAEVGFDEPFKIRNCYPHQLSGGQRQRIVLAQAIACGPRLLIADEPTSKLDATLRSEIAELLLMLHNRHGMAILLISHDVGLVSSLSHRIAMMYAGEMIELGGCADVLARPLHPYTQALLRLAKLSTAAAFERKARLPQIEAEHSQHVGCQSRCNFEPHCPDRMAVCAERSPHEIRPEPTRIVSCFRYGG